MQAEIANDPQEAPVVAESPAIKGKLGKRKKSIVVETAESKRSSPRIKVQQKKKSVDKHKHSDSEDFSAEAKKAGVLIPILANQKKPKGGSTGYALFCNEFKTIVKKEYKTSKSNIIEGQKGAPTQKQITKTANTRW